MANVVGNGVSRIIMDADGEQATVTSGKLDVNATLVAGATIDIGDVDMFLDGGTAILGGAGAVASGVLRVTLASDDPAVTALEKIDNAIHVDDGDFTLNSSSGIAMMGFKGSQNITTGDVGVLTCNQGGKLNVSNDASAELQVQIWSNTDADSGGDDTVPIVDEQGHFQIDVVSGTVTANLSATDNAVLDAMVVDLAAMEVLLTAANVDHAANEALLITIDSDTNAIKTAVEIIDNAISGSEMQVDVVAALPAGSNAIGKLAANSGVDIGDVDVTSIAAGTNIIGKVSHDITGGADGLKVVSSAGTDVVLGGDVDCKKIDIQSQTDNTGLIAVGFTGVDATEATGTGVILYAGDTYSIEVTNLNLIYIDSTVSGEGVRYTYWT